MCVSHYTTSVSFPLFLGKCKMNVKLITAVTLTLCSIIASLKFLKNAGSVAVGP